MEKEIIKENGQVFEKVLIGDSSEVLAQAQKDLGLMMDEKNAIEGRLTEKNTQIAKQEEYIAELSK